MATQMPICTYIMTGEILGIYGRGNQSRIFTSVVLDYYLCRGKPVGTGDVFIL
jgi:hypothetical protein